MKHLSIFLSMFYSIFCFAQNCEIPINELGNFEISEVIEAKEYSKAEIYDAAILSLSDYVSNADNLTKFRDREIGAFVTELEVSVKPVLGVDNLFFFNLKVEVKEGRYKITSNYIENLFILSEDSTCKCRSDIAYDDCDAMGCIVLKKRWAKTKCEAIYILEVLLKEYNKAVAINLSNSDW